MASRPVDGSRLDCLDCRSNSTGAASSRGAVFFFIIPTFWGETWETKMPTSHSNHGYKL